MNTERYESIKGTMPIYRQTKKHGIGKKEKKRTSKQLKKNT